MAEESWSTVGARNDEETVVSIDKLALGEPLVACFSGVRSALALVKESSVSWDGPDGGSAAEKAEAMVESGSFYYLCDDHSAHSVFTLVFHGHCFFSSCQYHAPTTY